MYNSKNRISGKIHRSNWADITQSLHDKGYSIVPGLLAGEQCDELIGSYDNPDGFRKTVVMERYRFGRGEYKYFDYPLPELVQGIRENLYPLLVPVANAWMKALKIDKKFPPRFSLLQAQCHAGNQLKPTPLLLKYTRGGFNTLHQDLYGDIYFPLQAAILLNQPAIDFYGGEFVITQQNPRAQSTAIVLQPARGDMLIFATNFRPVKGAKGYYRATMKHGVSEVLSGQQHTLGIIFHDALS